MAKKVLLQKPGDSSVKTGIVGFSWVTLFFNICVPLFRGDWKLFLPLFLFSCLISAPTANFYIQVVQAGMQNNLTALSTASVFWAQLQAIWGFILSVGGAFFYNKIYTSGLIKKGWRPLTEQDEALLKVYNIKVPADYELHLVERKD